MAPASFEIVDGSFHFTCLCLLPGRMKSRLERRQKETRGILGPAVVPTLPRANLNQRRKQWQSSACWAPAHLSFVVIEHLSWACQEPDLRVNIALCSREQLRLSATGVETLGRVAMRSGGLMDPADSSMVPAEGMDLGVVLVLTFRL